MKLIESTKVGEDVSESSLEFAKGLRKIAGDIERGHVISCAVVSIDKDDYVTSAADCETRKFMLMGGLVDLQVRISNLIERVG